MSYGIIGSSRCTVEKHSGNLEISLSPDAPPPRGYWEDLNPRVNKPNIIAANLELVTLYCCQKHMYMQNFFPVVFVRDIFGNVCTNKQKSK
jgi:hypothetical protein